VRVGRRRRAQYSEKKSMPMRFLPVYLRLSQAERERNERQNHN
jgi:hypothetical protein